MPVWAVSVANPRRRLTGGAGELWVLGVSLILLIVGLHIGSAGGLSQQVVTVLGMTDGVIETYKQKSASHHVWADIKGIWANDRTRADGKFFILANEGDSFIVSDAKGVYKTGQQIMTERVSATIGNSATTQIQTVSFNDEEVVPKLSEIAASYPNALVLVSGAIVVDVPETVRIPIMPNQLQTAQMVGNTVKFEFHPLERVLLELGEQYGTGTIALKAISPRPS